MLNWRSVRVAAARYSCSFTASTRCLPTDKIGSVFLADADIDMDVFRSQMHRFGKPKKPFYVVVSKDDQALRFSSLIAGGRTRLGDDANVEELAALGATVIDLTDVKANDPSNHSKFAQLADVSAQILTPKESCRRAGLSGVSWNCQRRFSTLQSGSFPRNSSTPLISLLPAKANLCTRVKTSA